DRRQHGRILRMTRDCGEGHGKRRQARPAYKAMHDDSSWDRRERGNVVYGRADALDVPAKAIQAPTDRDSSMRDAGRALQAPGKAGLRSGLWVRRQPFIAIREARRRCVADHGGHHGAGPSRFLQRERFGGVPVVNHYDGGVVVMVMMMSDMVAAMRAPMIMIVRMGVSMLVPMVLVLLDVEMRRSSELEIGDSERL